MKPLISSPEPPRDPMLVIMDEGEGVPNTVWEDAKAFCETNVETVISEEMLRRSGAPEGVCTGKYIDPIDDYCVVVHPSQLDEWLVIVPHNLIEGLPPGTVSAHQSGVISRCQFDFNAAYRHFLLNRSLELQMLPHLNVGCHWTYEAEKARLGKFFNEVAPLTYEVPALVMPQGILQAPGIDQAADRVAALQKEVKDMEQRKHQARRDAPRSAPYRRRERVSRNQPCPCGSGKKYKVCCYRFTTR